MIEISPLEKLDAEITVPGSKYIANRVLIIAALANGNSIIKNVPDNEDINASINALKKFGAEIKKEKDTLEIKGIEGIKTPDSEIDVHDSGTLMRFITGVASLAHGKTKITGSQRIQQRPVNDLLDGLKQLGVDSEKLNQDCPPFIVNGGSLKGGTVKIKANVSSQFVSSLLLIAPYAKEDVEIIIEDELVSKNYVDMTIEVMKQFNVNVEREGYKKFIVKSGQKYNAREYLIPSDISSANYFLAAAAIIPGRVKINNIDFNSKQESKFADILKAMGCEVRKEDNAIEVIGKQGLLGLYVDMSDAPDSAQTLAAVACFVKGTTKIGNIGNLKYKESDRINDTVSELEKVGIKASSTDNEMTIEGGTVSNAVIGSHNDHRMAMSFAIIGLKSGIKIQNPESVNKSFPGFFDKLREIGADVKDA